MLASSETVTRYKLVRNAKMLACVAAVTLLAACSSEPAPPPAQPAPAPAPEAAPPPPPPAPPPVPPARG